MCLTLRNFWERRSRFTLMNKKVYKVVRVVSSRGEICFQSPFHRYDYKLGETYRVRGMRSEQNFITPIAMVERGLHVLVNEQQAKNLCRNFVHMERQAFAVLECVVPRFTKYYTGEWSHFDLGTYDSIACSRLEVRRIIDRQVYPRLHY